MHHVKVITMTLVMINITCLNANINAVQPVTEEKLPKLTFTENIYATLSSACK